MHHVDLFSGIGGFALGARWAGVKFDRSFHSDIDEFANKVYAKHFPESVSLGDITKVNWHELKKKNKGEWFVTGGFPCQDISIAGKGAGLAGSRSGLWFEMHKAIRILRPRFVIAENVGAITFRGLAAVIASLAEIGYNVEWQDICAADVGAPHKRERIWIIAYAGCVGRSGSGRQQYDIKERSFRSNVANDGTGIRGESTRHDESSGEQTGNSSDVANSTSERLGEKRRHSQRSAQRTSGDNSTSVTANSKSGKDLGKNKRRLLESSSRSNRNATDISGKGLQGRVKNNTVKRSQSSDEQFIGRDRDYSGVRSWREDWLTVASELCRMDDGVSSELDGANAVPAEPKKKTKAGRQHRLRGLGNSIVPQIAMILFLLIKPYLKK